MEVIGYWERMRQNWMPGGQPRLGHYVFWKIPSEVFALLNERKMGVSLPCNLGRSGYSHSRIIASEETLELILSSFKDNSKALRGSPHGHEPPPYEMS